jgi:uncharacterized iron-regulated membrane protein
MFWVLLLAVGSAFTFSTLGAQSVWLKIFSLGLKGSLALLLVLGGLYLWSNFSRRKMKTRNGFEHRDERR